VLIEWSDPAAYSFPRQISALHPICDTIGLTSVEPTIFGWIEVRSFMRKILRVGVMPLKQTNKYMGKCMNRSEDVPAPW
jgi:hypothetical protein